MDVELAVLDVLVAGGEGMVNATKSKTELDQGAASLDAEFSGTRAPRQKLWVVVNVGDQSVHLFRAVPQQYRSVNGLHAASRVMTTFW
jgi:ribosomal silencing factor RsfS